MFNNLKSQLFKEKLVKFIDKKLGKIQPGEFVEISGILKINPLITMMENMAKVLELAAVIQNEGS